MAQKIIVSRPSLQHLAETLDKHTNEKFAAQREAKVAKEWGDLSENAEYKASKEKFRLAGRLQQRVGRELRRLADDGYIVVDPLDWARAPGEPKQAEVGVVVRVSQGGIADDFLIAGAKDRHLDEETSLTAVPYTAPLGQALINQTAPKKVIAEIAGEKRTLLIESLRRPTIEEIVRLYPELSMEAEG